MESIEIVKGGLVDAHRNIGFALDELTEEVAHWQPPGTANTIASLLAHAVCLEDRIINQVIGGGQTLLESGGWSAKTGIPSGDNAAIWGRDWRLNVAGFQDYVAAVCESADVCVTAMSAADLDREAAYGQQGSQTVGFLLRRMVVSHMIGHAGEMSAIKGVQGLKGLPF